MLKSRLLLLAMIEVLSVSFAQAAIPLDRVVEVESKLLKQVAAKINREGYRAEEAQKAIQERFPGQRDMDYFWLQNRRSVRAPKVSARSVGATLVLESPGLPRIVLSDFDPDRESFKINGHLFESDSHRSLEEAIHEFAKLAQAPQGHAAHFYDWLVPSAHADLDPILWWFMGYQAARLGIKAAKIAYTALFGRIIQVTERCQQERGSGVPYDQSEAKKLHQDLSKSQAVDLDKDREPDCDAFVRKASNGPLSDFGLKKHCEEKNAMIDCMKAYRDNIPTATVPAAPASSQGTGAK